MTVNPVSSAFNAYQNAAPAQEVQAAQLPGTGGNIIPETAVSPMQAANEAAQTAREAAAELEAFDVAALQENEQAMLYQADATASQQVAAAMTGAGGQFSAFA